VKLQTKVAIAVIGVTALFSLLLGTSIVMVTYGVAISEVEKNISSFEKRVVDTKEDTLSVALLLGESSNLNIKYFEADGTVTSIVENYVSTEPSREIAKTLKLGGGESLQISSSIENQLSARNVSLLLTLILSVISGITSGLISLGILRSDIKVISKLTKDAEQIASGDLQEITATRASEEIQKLSEALTTMTSQLQRSRDQMKVFLGDASHELKTPLTVIRGYLDLLSRHDEISPEKRKIAIERSLSESLRMQRLVSDLLRLAELEEAPRIEMHPFDLGLLIKASISDLKMQQPNRKVNVSLEADTIFVGSVELMTQLISNALQNIVRYTKETDPVRITLQTFDEKTYLLVEDGGPGIASLRDGRVINSFNRFDESRSRSAGGSGLGLTIMAKIVDLHSGKMELSRSELGGLQVATSFPQKHVT